MSYLFYLGMIMVMLYAYTYVTTTLAIANQYIHGQLRSKRWVYDFTFFVTKTINAYLVVSLLLVFSKFFSASDLASLPRTLISYFGLIIFWKFKTSGGRMEYDRDRWYKLTADHQTIIFGIFTGVFCLMYFGELPPEPYLSKLFLIVMTALADFKIFVILVTTVGLCFVIGYLGHAYLYFEEMLDREENEV